MVYNQFGYIYIYFLRKQFTVAININECHIDAISHHILHEANVFYLNENDDWFLLLI